MTTERTLRQGQSGERIAAWLRSLQYVFQSALWDFLHPRRVVVWVCVALGVALLSFTWNALGVQKTLAASYAEISVPMVYRLLPLVAAVFSSAIITQEIAQKTIVYLVTRPVPRSALIVGRILAAAVVVSVVIAFTSTAVSFAVYRSMSALNMSLVHDMWVLALGATAYVTFFSLVTLWANKPMVICLLFAFGWETLVTTLPGDLYRLSILSYVIALGEKPSMDGAAAVISGQAGVNTLTVGTALPVLILVSAVCLVAAAAWFSFFEYVPREDTE